MLEQKLPTFSKGDAKQEKQRVSWKDEMAPCLHLTAANVGLASETLAEEMRVSPSTSPPLAGPQHQHQQHAGAQGWHTMPLTPTAATSCSALGRPQHKLKAQLLTMLHRDF